MCSNGCLDMVNCVANTIGQYGIGLNCWVIRGTGIKFYPTRACYDSVIDLQLVMYLPSFTYIVLYTGKEAVINEEDYDTDDEIKR